MCIGTGHHLTKQMNLTTNKYKIIILKDSHRLTRHLSNSTHKPKLETWISICTQMLDGIYLTYREMKFCYKLSQHTQMFKILCWMKEPICNCLVFHGFTYIKYLQGAKS